MNIVRHTESHRESSNRQFDNAIDFLHDIHIYINTNEGQITNHQCVFLYTHIKHTQVYVYIYPYINTWNR